MNRITVQQISPHAENIHKTTDSTVLKQTGVFRNLLEQAIQKSNGLGIKFSSHAINRLRTRNIAVSSEDVARLTDAVQRAEEKGSRESLVLMNNLAFVVSVKNKTVVTAMTRDQMKENVITNIDSTVIV